MGRPSAALQDQIASLKQELELSSFLNKGVLATNAELKERLELLQTENSALRAAEKQLSTIEASLEAALADVKHFKERTATAERRAARAEESKRRAVERASASASAPSREAKEAATWRARFERVQRALEDVNSEVAEEAAASARRKDFKSAPTPVSTISTTSSRTKKRSHNEHHATSTDDERDTAHTSPSRPRKAAVKTPVAPAMERTSNLPVKRKKVLKCAPSPFVALPTPEVTVKEEAESDWDPLGSFDDIDEF